MDRVRRRTARLLLFLIILAAQFAIFESALRTWGSSEAAPAFQSLFMGDPHIGYRLQPGAHTRFRTSEFDTVLVINGSGIRDADEIGAKAANEHRIVILGDSMVLAVQVRFEETFGELLEQRLNSGQSQPQFRVINAGVQGYGPVQALLFFTHVAAAFEPDLVILTLYVGNDAEEAASDEQQLAGAPPAAFERFRDTFSTRLRRIVRRSMVLQVLRVRVIESMRPFASRSGAPEPPLQSYAAEPSERIQRGLAVTRRVVEQLSAAASGAGARTAVVLIPARFQLDDDDYGRLHDIVKQAGGELLRDGASQRFATALSGLSVPVFDLLPALRQYPDRSELYFQQTAHLTALGHDAVAHALADFLRTSGLLEPAAAAAKEQ